jgi:hypothetical protein
MSPQLPPIRAQKTHEANERAGLHLKNVFGNRPVGDLTADDIELYVRRRLQARVQFKTANGIVQKDRLNRRRFTRSCEFFDA